jgi:Y-X(10)_GDL-associated radical SAM protein
MTDTSSRPARERRTDDFRDHVPVHVVWEITLACDLKCRHCGSRAGRAREDELTTRECLDVIDSLARLGTREVTMIGGEAYLRRDWVELVRAIRGHGMYCALQTGGRNLSERRLEAAVAAGLQGVGVSVDGLEPLHDDLRGVKGSYQKALETIRRVKRSGLAVSANTQIGARTMADLPELMRALIAAGATHWQLQLTVAMGNAVDDPELLLQPYQIAELMPLLAELHREGLERDFLLLPGNNIGYFGPFEHVFRGIGNDAVHWSGCAAGQNVIGLEADGSMKGCPSLRTKGFTGGNVRHTPPEEIWHQAEALHFARARSVDDLWGFCRSCYYADVCRAGCTWTADSLFGRPGNNPYCHHRTLQLEKQGLRERVVKKRDAPGESFAIGEFALVVEAIPGREPVLPPEPPPHLRPGEVSGPGPLLQLRRKTGVAAADVRHGRTPPRLPLCRACQQYVLPHERDCPHCGADLASAELAHAQVMTRRRALMTRLEAALASRGPTA